MVGRAESRGARKRDRAKSAVMKLRPEPLEWEGIQVEEITTDL
jgi:hypothetical protein